MKNSMISTVRFALMFLLLASLVSACAELDQLMKPSVQGLQKASGFNGEVLQQGGVGEVHVHSSLAKKKININALESIFVAALRDKRRDVTVGQNGQYQITAEIIANDVSKRADNLEAHIYRWTKRRVKVNYVITDSKTDEQVWSGIIETSREAVSSYELDKDNKSRDKAIDAVVAVVSGKEVYPYPSAPLLSDIAQLNFEGFALNLPMVKK